LQKDFMTRYNGAPGQSRQTAYDRAVHLMQTSAARAFDLDAEPAKLRDRYGRNLFGQGCLLARRLVEQVCKALGIDPLKQNRSNVDRPIRIVDKSAEPIKEVLA
jgi:hypothetical protein